MCCFVVIVIGSGDDNGCGTLIENWYKKGREIKIAVAYRKIW